MKNLLKTHCVTLTVLESQQISGGADKLKTSFWHNVAFVGGAIAHGIIVFSTQGGRNAGLCVR